MCILAKFENRLVDDYSERLLLQLLNDLYLNNFNYSTNLMRFSTYDVQFGKVVDRLNIVVSGLNVEGLNLYKQDMFDCQLSGVFDIISLEYYSLVMWNSELVQLVEQLVFCECQKFADIIESFLNESER